MSGSEIPEAAVSINLLRAARFHVCESSLVHLASPCRRLNELSFEWKLTDADAKWHHLYHQLRQYKLLYGTTNINPRNSSKDACDWVSVSK